MKYQIQIDELQLKFGKMENLVIVRLLTGSRHHINLALSKLSRFSFVKVRICTKSGKQQISHPPRKRSKHEDLFLLSIETNLYIQLIFEFNDFELVVRCYNYLQNRQRTTNKSPPKSGILEITKIYVKIHLTFESESNYHIVLK